MIIYSIYRATNKTNGKVYIGYTNNFKRRLTQYRYIANNGRGYKFHNALVKYGFDGFIWEIIYQSRECHHTKDIIEPLLIQEYKSDIHGYNTTKGGEGTVGYNPSVETRKKMSDSHKGQSRKHSPETKEKIRQAILGRKHSKETKEKIGQMNVLSAGKRTTYKSKGTKYGPRKKVIE